MGYPEDLRIHMTKDTVKETTISTNLPDLQRGPTTTSALLTLAKMGLHMSLTLVFALSNEPNRGK